MGGSVRVIPCRSRVHRHARSCLPAPPWLTNLIFMGSQRRRLGETTNTYAERGSVFVALDAWPSDTAGLMDLVLDRDRERCEVDGGTRWARNVLSTCSPGTLSPSSDDSAIDILWQMKIRSTSIVTRNTYGGESSIRCNRRRPVSSDVISPLLQHV